MEKFIKIGKEKVSELAKMFGVSERAVAYALKYERNSPISEKIREAALKIGGKMMQEVDTHKVVKVLDSHGNVTQVINQ